VISQPAWERVLRRRLRQKAKKHASKGNLDVKDLIALTLVGACVIAGLSLAAVSDTGRMVAVTLVTGACGTLLGAELRARWQDGIWLAPYAPVDIRGMRRVETRAALPNLIRIAVMGLLMAIFGSFAGWPFAVVKAVPVAASALVTGMVFSSGRWGKIILWASGLGATGWSVAEIMRKDLGPGSIAHGYLDGWLPAFPLSLWAGDGALFLPRLAVFALALAVVSREWRKAWRGVEIAAAWNPQSPGNQSDLPAAEETPIESHEAEETEDPRPALRDDVRATVTRGWVGLAGYVDGSQLGRIDKLLWKYLLPRQRMLSCLGIYGTKLWLRRVKIAGILLIAGVALVWTMRLAMQNHFGPTMAKYGVLLGLPALGIALFAFAFSSPGPHPSSPDSSARLRRWRSSRFPRPNGHAAR